MLAERPRKIHKVLPQTPDLGNRCEENSSLRQDRYPLSTSIEIGTDWYTGELRVLFPKPPDADDLRSELSKRYNCYIKNRKELGMGHEVLKVLWPGVVILAWEKGGEEREKNGVQLRQIDIGESLESFDRQSVLERLREKRVSAYMLRDSENGKTKRRPREEVINERIASFLVGQRGRFVTDEELIVAGWNVQHKDAIQTYRNNLCVAICQIRKSLEGDSRNGQVLLASSGFKNRRYFVLLPRRVVEAGEGEILTVFYPGFEEFLRNLSLDDALRRSALSLASFEVHPEKKSISSYNLFPRTTQKNIAYLIAFLISENQEVSLEELRIFTSSGLCNSNEENWEHKIHLGIGDLRQKIKRLELPIKIESISWGGPRKIDGYRLVVLEPGFEPG